MLKKCIGFTLAEVLITLGIIGIVAAMTIPGLMNNAKATKLRSQYLKAYSTLGQVMLKIQDEGDDIEPSNYYDNPTAYKTIFMQYLAGATDCGYKAGAFQSDKAAPCYNAGRYADYAGRPKYMNLNNTAGTDGVIFESGQILLSDGSLWLFYLQNKWHPTLLTIDINGYKSPPNRLGYDLFTFQYYDGTFIPSGALHTSYTDEKYCSETDTGSYNGIGCTVKANSNSDYFKWAVKKFK
jgi:prepilin-type N-terminal cleavage/methylation domain-containing protein